MTGPTSGLLWAMDCAVAALLVVWHARGLLPRQPEPDPASPGADSKPPYSKLATWPFTASCVLLAALCQLAGVVGVPAHRPLWISWGSAVLVLVAVDARTTWLPRRLTWWCLGQVGVAIGLAAWWARDPGALAGAALGGAATGALFWLVWRLGAGLGFGDVRLALGLGALSGAVSAEFWFASLLGASVVGALWGLIWTALRGRGAPFA